MSLYQTLLTFLNFRIRKMQNLIKPSRLNCRRKFVLITITGAYNISSNDFKRRSPESSPTFDITEGLVFWWYLINQVWISIQSGKRARLVAIVLSFRSEQQGQHFAGDIFKCIFLNENRHILMRVSLKFVPGGPIDNTSPLVQVIWWST